MYSRQLLILLTVAETGSFTKAAERLFVTPAAVMKHVNLFEKQHGVQLFERSPRGVRPTAAGRILIQAGKDIAQASECALQQAREAAVSETRTLRIGTSNLNPSHLLTDFWDACRKPGDPKFHMRLISYRDDNEQILSVVESLGHDLDFLVGVFDSRIIFEKSHFLPLGKTSLCVAVPHSHPLAHKRELQIDDLFDRPLTIVEKGDSLHIDRFREEMAKYPRIQLVDTGHFYDLNTFNACERTGTPLLTLDIWSRTHPGLRTVPVNWDFCNYYGILYSPAIEGPPREFLEIVRARSLQVSAD